MFSNIEGGGDCVMSGGRGGGGECEIWWGENGGGVEGFKCNMCER